MSDLEAIANSAVMQELVRQRDDAQARLAAEIGAHAATRQHSSELDMALSEANAQLEILREKYGVAKYEELEEIETTITATTGQIEELQTSLLATINRLKELDEE